MRSVIIFIAFCALSAHGFPADVIKVTDDSAPIILEDTIVGRNTNATEPLQPAPVPDNVPITTEKPVQNTPSLVPQVVEISSTAPPQQQQQQGNGTSSTNPEEEDDDSDEEDSEEEADEGDEDDNEDEDDEEDDEEEEEDEQDLKSKSNRVSRDVALNEEIGGSVKVPANKPVSVVFLDEDKSDEDDLVVLKKIEKKPSVGVIESASKLQSIPARTPTNEDDEDEKN